VRSDEGNLTLLQVVPQLPPAVEGVGGHATALAHALERHHVDCRFLVTEPTWRGTGDQLGYALRARSAACVARQLTETDADVVLLQYVNYSYQRRGCPAWLIAGVARWRGGSRSRRLVTIFHEVSASGPPWRSSFWTSPIQRGLAARLLRTSDAAITSTGLYGRLLARWGPRRQVIVAPVFSNIGEPALVPAPADRQPRIMVVFGGPGNRQRAYSELPAVLAASCRALQVVEIIDVGPPLHAPVERIESVPVRTLGVLSAEEASSVLLRSYAGFLAYPSPFLAKSGVYAAYCAHGLVPVCAWPGRTRLTGDEPPPCWDPTSTSAPLDVAWLAKTAREWYLAHSLARQASSLANLLAALVEEGRKELREANKR
jgi:hypothetical protein